MFMSSLQQRARRSLAIATDPRWSGPLSYLLLVFDAVLSVAIIKKVSYTEIDWEAYMQQIETYRSGERDYRNIKGETGPLVYPAGHVYVFDALYGLTNGGKDRWLVQAAFWSIYVVTLWIVMTSYRLAKAPPWIFPLLVLSKRLHSIYLLRFFNDCVSTLLMCASILLLQKKHTTVATIAYSTSVSVKMSSLLYLPGFGLILFYLLETRNALFMAANMLQMQILMALPFLVGQGASPWGYLSRAFEFSREFLFRWTVNWRFCGPTVFSSPIFKYTLLCSHVLLLLAFLVTRWTRPTKQSAWALLRAILQTSNENAKERHTIIAATNPRFILTTLTTCNLIGMLCARSLHYQFYAWMAWYTPFLLWTSRWGPIYVFTVWFSQEVAWNVYPSTHLSSLMAVGCMGVALAGVWTGTKEGKGIEQESRTSHTSAQRDD